jgi:hypothetical protein
MNKIEQMFYDALLAVFRNHMNNEDYKDGMDAMEYLSLFEPGEIGNIETLNYQVPMGIYIVDFLIVSTEGQEFVIEIDGHEFHKKTSAVNNSAVLSDFYGLFLAVLALETIYS